MLRGSKGNGIKSCFKDEKNGSTRKENNPNEPGGDFQEGKKKSKQLIVPVGRHLGGERQVRCNHWGKLNILREWGGGGCLHEVEGSKAQSRHLNSGQDPEKGKRKRDGRKALEGLGEVARRNGERKRGSSERGLRTKMVRPWLGK